jgi:hypothetical protein
MKAEVRNYLSKIGRKGGEKSRRRLSTQQARQMVAVREAQKAYLEHHAECFWSYDRSATIGHKDVSWIVQNLMNEGNRKTFEKARRLKQLLRETE